MTDPVVVVGGGQVAVQLCLALRKEKYQGDIVVLSEENELPYHRPPLSKAYITGKTDDEKLVMRPFSFYESRNIDLKLNTAVTAIDCDRQTVHTQNSALKYRYLVLATGALARQLPIEGKDANGVFELRDLPDARALKAHLDGAADVVVIGAGFIGLEAAAALRQTGCRVTVFDTADRVMGRAVSPEVSQWFTETHTQAGINILLNEGIARIAVDSNHQVCGVVRQNGETVSADTVLIGVGVLPHVELADSAGISCDNGIVVDEYCRTSTPAVFAAGDCASHPNRFAGGRHVRLESVQNATDQARTIAGVIAAADQGDQSAAPYAAVPWFWSDQAEHSLQMTGLAYDVNGRVTRGDPDAGSFSVFQFNGAQLVAVDSVNASRDHMLARKMLASSVSPSFEQVADSDFDLKTLI